MFGKSARILLIALTVFPVLNHAIADVDATTSGQSFRQNGYIKASNSDSADRFGTSLDISENTIVIGAPNEDSNATGVNGDQSNESAGKAGAVYVFEFDEFGAIQQQAYLKASNSGSLDRFGSSVAISGDTIVIGSPSEDSSSSGVNGDQSNNLAQGSGAAYVFVKSGSTWSQQAYLKASNVDQLDEFGGTVDISGDTVVVGARFEDSAATGVNNQSSDYEYLSGAAYIFERSGSNWSQQAYLKASNTDSDDQFGTVVAVADDTVVVTAPNESSGATGIDGDQSDNSGFQSGAAYVFSRNELGQWFQEAYIKSSNSDDLHQFGLSASIDADTIAIGAPVENGGLSSSEGERFEGTITFSGAAYVFLRDEVEGWQEQAYLKASNAGQFDEFGNAVSVSGDLLLVGAALEDSDSTGIGGAQASDAARNAGAAYLFERDEQSVWSQRAYVKASTVDSVDLFGHSLAIFGTNFIAGAIGEDSGATGINGDQNNSAEPNSGAVYAFRLPAYIVGGVVTGLAGVNLVLDINGADALTVNSNGSFTVGPSEMEIRLM